MISHTFQFRELEQAFQILLHPTKDYVKGIVFFDYKRLDFGFARGYEGSNHAPVYMYNCHGRSPQWNLVITRTESQSNSAIDEDNNNPDPSNLIKLWPSEWKDAEWVDD